MKLILSNSMITVDKRTSNVIYENIDTIPRISIHNDYYGVLYIYPRNESDAEKDINKLIEAVSKL